MKKLFILLILNFIVFFVNSQNSCVTMLPDTGNAIKMIRTLDNKYVALALLNDSAYGGGVYNKLGLYKYNNQCVLEWAKYYTYEGTGQFSYLDFIQLENNNFAICGQLNWKPFIALFNSSGDTIWIKRYDNYPVDNMFQNLVDMQEFSQIWLTGGGLPDHKAFVHKIDYYGNIVEVDSNQITLPAGPSYTGNKMIKMNDSILFTTGNGKYIITDFSLFTYKTVQYSIQPLKVRKDPFGGYIIHDNAYYAPQSGSNNGKGLVKLSNHLDSLWTVPVSHYYGYGAELYGCPSDLIITNDGGIAMCGSMYWDYQYVPYLIKTDSVGNPIIIRLYTDIIPNGAINLFEETDGSFIILESRGVTPRRMFIVKTNTDGSVNFQVQTADKKDINVYPNPVSRELNIDITYPFTGTIEIYNLVGEEVYCDYIINTTNYVIDINNFKAGNYILKIFNEKNELFFEKIIKY